MPTVINIKNLPTGFQSIIDNGKHSILGDEPIKSKGTDLGFAPTDLILSSLAMCKVATVRYIARKNGWEDLIRDVDGQLSLVVKRGKDGQLTSKVKVALKIEGDISPEQKVELLKQADNCYIHRMVEGDWEIESATELVDAVNA
ncbi:OsmC family protein [Aureispira anguillae]|uniref:OsmC family protein n=1 Tax=Aureispira anguillae TaxID=2864201 RepID=A0A916DNI7_9BACT|nr:OsmC family protein [Aureispira anguillae]BDS09909.1 OsmC family protein [Aureispira anguillae]